MCKGLYDTAGHEERHELDYTEQDYMWKEQFFIGHRKTYENLFNHSQIYKKATKNIKST